MEAAEAVAASMRADRVVGGSILFLILLLDAALCMLYMCVFLYVMGMGYAALGWMLGVVEWEAGERTKRGEMIYLLIYVYMVTMIDVCLSSITSTAHT